ncbi:MAG: EscN/YscN/HrcN family type III secretion system ATPase, partial [Peptococcia bacterium]
IKGAYLGTSIAEYFRDQGAKVVLMMDSVTRFAMAQREIGLAIGEPPATKGYTPSVFAALPKLLERSGTSNKGSITGLYTVLVDGDDVNEPISDAVRGILDGHIVLSRRLASLGHYPAIDVLPSVSRVMPNVISAEHQKAAIKFKELLAVYQEAKDLIDVGAYQIGSNPKIDLAIKHMDEMNSFLRQGVDDSWEYEKTLSLLEDIHQKISSEEES